jgi:glyoxylase-like metal-dependent hydrolase (beta-lactamase superfamily II)
MNALRLADGVWRVPTTRSDRDNAFLVEGDDGLTLIDVGWAGAPSRLTAALDDMNRNLSDIARIIVTHAHPDHVRGLAAFRRVARRAKVLIHADDSSWLQDGRVPAGGRHGRFGVLLDALPLLHWSPVRADGELTDGMIVEASNGLRVIHTPGHSPGHVVLVHEPTRTLFAGDAIFHRGSEPVAGPAALCWDPAVRDQSARLLPRDIAAVGFAHGGPLGGARVEAYLNWLPS